MSDFQMGHTGRSAGDKFFAMGQGKGDLPRNIGPKFKENISKIKGLGQMSGVIKKTKPNGNKIFTYK